MDLIKIAEEAFATKKELPSFKSGDTITVAYRIKEGNKERIQQYRGVVRKQESKKRECNLSDSIAIRKAIQRNAGWLFVYRFLQCPS